MTPEEHKKRHQALHNALVDLLAEYIMHANGHIFNPITDLVDWSHQQTQELDHEPK